MLASPHVRAASERLGALEPGIAAPTLAAAAVCAAALLFGGGFDDPRLVWIGGAVLGLAALLAAAALLRALPAPALDLPGSVFLGCLFGLATWAGLSTLWSVSPDRSWAYTNRTLVYAAFALLGVLVSAFLPRLTRLAEPAAALIAVVIVWALVVKCAPALYSDYGRVARLRAPLGYWNELALVCVVAVPLALWLAAPPGRSALVRAGGASLLFLATVTLLLTYSRFGVVLACLAAAAWVLLERDRLESLAVLALAGGLGVGVFGIALALPGITNDGEPRSTRAHDGWIFALVVLGGVALVFAAARVLGGLEARSPLLPDRRRRLERAAGIAALALAIAGVVLSVVFAGRIWHEFTNPVSSQISSTSNRLGSASSSNRWRWWGEEWHAFTAHPLGGTGAGTFKVTDLRVRNSPITTDEPHNTPLQFLGELGIVGFLLYVAAAAAAAVAIVRARRRAEGAERAAVTALGIGLAAFGAHTVVDMDWNFVATCGPLLLLAGALVGRAAPSPRAAAMRRPLLAAACVVFALGAFYSLAAPWLAQRELDSATSALGRSDLAGAISHAKRAHSWDPLSTSVLLDLAAFEDDAPLKAQDLYRKAVSLEPQSSEVWFALGDFYWAHGAWKPAYDAYSNAWQYDRFGPAGRPCGALDVARHKVLGTWPASCPRGRPRAATP